MKIRLCVFIVLCFCSLGSAYAGDSETKIDWNETGGRIERPLMRSGLQPLSAYINSSIGELSLVSGRDLGLITVTIVNGDGEYCYSNQPELVQQCYLIDLSSYEAGVYLLEIQGKNGSYWRGSFRL